MNQQVDDLLAALHSPDDQAHQAAYEALVALGRATVPALIAAFPGTRGRARLSVIRALGEIGDARAVALLVSLVRSRDRQEYVFVSSLAAKSLGQIAARPGSAGEQAIAGLVEALGDSLTGARRMAAVVLGNVGDPQAVPPLIGALADSDIGVRALSARALGLIGMTGKHADHAVPALIVCLADTAQLGKPLAVDGRSVRTVSEVAAWALEQINTPQAAHALATWRAKRQ